MTMLEINPIVETSDGEVKCLDAKMGFDDNAEFRQKDIFAQRDISQEDPQEIEAKEKGYEYIRLDGNIGCNCKKKKKCFFFPFFFLKHFKIFKLDYFQNNYGVNT